MGLCLDQPCLGAHACQTSPAWEHTRVSDSKHTSHDLHRQCAQALRQTRGWPAGGEETAAWPEQGDLAGDGARVRSRRVLAMVGNLDFYIQF